ncbi:MAG: ATP-binding protein [Parvularcula sp.]|nr:ATP-binding protein [Parvularcula sp.]
MFSTILNRYETFLRIENCERPWDKVRARGVYLIAWLFSFLQLLNLAGMTHTYGRWTFDHNVSVTIIIVFLLVPFLLRWSKQFFLYLLLFAATAFLAVLAASTHSGIHSALLPFVVVGPMMAGFLSGWRTALVFGLFALSVLVHLLLITLGGDVSGTEYPLHRTEQRFLQAVFALTFATSMSVLLSRQCQNAFQSLEAALDEAARSARLKDRFLANMSHELRTPMNGVLGLTEAVLASRAEPPTPRQAELLARVKDSGEHLLSLLNDLLDASKIDAGKLAIEPRVFAVRQLVQSVRDTYEGLAQTKGLDFKVTVAPCIPEHVCGDDTRLRQILSNLVSNAIKFTEQGHVGVEVRRGEGDELLFLVSDTGKGIAPAMRGQIFERFEQGEAGTTRSFGGTGLGLSICRDLAALMRGGIRLLPTEAGTCFELRVPMPAALSTAKPARRDWVEETFDGLRVLVAEDNQVNQMVLGEFLKRWGATVVFAADGVEALDLFAAGDFDLVLVDRQMPGLDGEQVVEAIRRSPGSRSQIPVIAVTADVLDSDRRSFLGKGANGFVAKPVKPQALNQTISEVLQTAREPSAAAEQRAGAQPG